MDPRQAQLVKENIQDNYAFGLWEPITAELLNADVLYGVYAFVEVPARVKVPHSTLFLRSGRDPKWYSLGLAWKPKGDFYRKAIISLAKSCEGVSISSPDPSGQIYEPGGPNNLPGHYITPVWAGRITAEQRDKLLELLASMTNVQTGKRGKRVRTGDPMKQSEFPLQRFSGKGYRIFGNNCTSVVEELLNVSCMKRWFHFFKRTDPKSCHFDPEVHPVDLSFLSDGKTTETKLLELQRRGVASRAVEVIEQEYRDRVLRI